MARGKELRSLWLAGWLRPFRPLARGVFLAAAVVILGVGAMAAAVSLVEGDAQFGLVPLFFGLYLLIAYGAILGVDRLVQLVERFLRGL